jgi:hypothetical protein
MLTAISTSDSHRAAHFDCVLRQIATSEALRPKERVIYLGNGGFGIVRFHGSDSGRRFTIRKRIQFEPAEGNVPWRETVSSQLPVVRPRSTRQE